MIEIPESTTLARQLKQEINGKKITEVDAGHSPHGFAFYTGDPAEYGGLLCGRRVDDVRFFAGQVEIWAGEMRVLFFDGVNVRLVPKDGILPKKYQMYIGFEDGTGIVCTIQMYGVMLAYRAGENDSPYYHVALEKPSPLSGEFDAAYFDRIVAQAEDKLSAKALLATQQRIPGLGNGCLQDILYHAGVNPQTKLAKLGDAEIEALYKSVKSTLADMVAGGGRDVEKDLYGKPGGYGVILSSKTADYACRQCGSGIVRKAFLGGNVYFCPRCQPLVK